LVLLGT